MTRRPKESRFCKVQPREKRQRSIKTSILTLPGAGFSGTDELCAAFMARCGFVLILESAIRAFPHGFDRACFGRFPASRSVRAWWLRRPFRPADSLCRVQPL